MLMSPRRWCWVGGCLTAALIAGCGSSQRAEPPPVAAEPPLLTQASDEAACATLPQGLSSAEATELIELPRQGIEDANAKATAWVGCYPDAS